MGHVKVIQTGDVMSWVTQREFDFSFHLRLPSFRAPALAIGAKNSFVRNPLRITGQREHASINDLIKQVVIEEQVNNVDIWLGSSSPSLVALYQLE